MFGRMMWNEFSMVMTVLFAKDDELRDWNECDRSNNELIDW